MKEFAVLQLLLEAQGAVVPAEELHYRQPRRGGRLELSEELENRRRELRGAEGRDVVAGH